MTEDIQPFLSALAAEGRMEDEMFLTQFAFEEAKQVAGFRRWLDAVGATDDLHELVGDNPGYRQIFCTELPRDLAALRDDPSPAAQVRASVTYNHVVEGTLALTGYHIPLPFGIETATIAAYAMDRGSRRFGTIESARAAPCGRSRATTRRCDWRRPSPARRRRSAAPARATERRRTPAPALRRPAPRTTGAVRRFSLPSRYGVLGCTDGHGQNGHRHALMAAVIGQAAQGGLVAA